MSLSLPTVPIKYRQNWKRVKTHIKAQAGPHINKWRKKLRKNWDHYTSTQDQSSESSKDSEAEEEVEERDEEEDEEVEEKDEDEEVEERDEEEDEDVEEKERKKKIHLEKSNKSNNSKSNVTVIKKMMGKQNIPIKLATNRLKKHATTILKQIEKFAGIKLNMASISLFLIVGIVISILSYRESISNKALNYLLNNSDVNNVISQKDSTGKNVFFSYIFGREAVENKAQNIVKSSLQSFIPFMEKDSSNNGFVPSLLKHVTKHPILLSLLSLLFLILVALCQTEQKNPLVCGLISKLTPSFLKIKGNTVQIPYANPNTLDALSRHSNNDHSDSGSYVSGSDVSELDVSGSDNNEEDNQKNNEEDNEKE